MDNQNITLSLKKDTLHKVKQLAIEKRTSISKLLTSTLEQIVEKEDSYLRAKKRNQRTLEKGFKMGTNGEKSWKREDIYE